MHKAVLHNKIKAEGITLADLKIHLKTIKIIQN